MSFNKVTRRLSAALVLVAATAIAQVPSSQHVVLVIDENSSFSEVTANMPWLIGQGDTNGYAANYQSDTSGSLMDYLWLSSGSCHSSANCTLPSGTHNFNCNINNCYYPGTSTSDPITDDSIFRELNNAGISWKVYAQSYAAAGGTVTSPDNGNGTSYYRRHNGATWYSDILNDVNGSAEKIVDLSQLTTDLANGQLPRFVIIVPDGNHDAHDCPVGMSSCSTAQKLAAADSFLSTTLAPILNTSDFQGGGDGLLIVTFDECGDGTNGGCGAAVYTALIGPNIRPHTASSIAYRHENTLRTILDSLGIKTYPGAAATATDMSDFFTASGRPAVTVNSPVGGASLISPVSLQSSASPTANHAITGWRVYVDGLSVYSAGAVNAIVTSLNMSPGAHTVLVRAWDSSGAFGDQTISLTVSATRPTVAVSAPANSATVDSPVTIQASATPSAGRMISGWWIYVDKAGTYSAGATASINASIAMATGAHTVVVRAWDNAGAYGDQTLSLTVGNKPVVVTVSTPANGSGVTSPINIQASGTASTGHTITGWRVYVDGVGAYQAGAIGTINANVAASPGTHSLLVRAWDSTGAFGDQTLSVQVAGGLIASKPISLSNSGLTP